MSITEPNSELSRKTEQLAKPTRQSASAEEGPEFPSHPLWGRLRELDTELWLDAADPEAISEVWTGEFAGVVTSSTHLGRQIGTGDYDDLILRAGELLDGYPLLPDHERMREVAFILNTRHALRLEGRFDACVCVEEHMDWTDNLEEAINYARRFHALSPDRLQVSIPFSAAGLLVARSLSDDEVPINQTMAFSARQSYLAARIAQPRFVNVHVGLLNDLAAVNGFGGEQRVGERTALASQAVIRQLRKAHGLATRQVATGLREGKQVAELAGVDVICMPPGVAKEFLDLGLEPGDLRSMTADSSDPEEQAARRECPDTHALLKVNAEVVACADALGQERLDMFTAERLRGFFQRHGCGDVLVKWTDQQVEAIAEEGEVPCLANWREELAAGQVGLDSLMSLAAWIRLRREQETLDRRVEKITALAGQ